MNTNMTCHEAREQILCRLDDGGDAGDPSLDAHVATCADCARFAEQQHELDRRLSLAVSPVKLAPGFRAAVRSRIAAEQKEPWANMLPDVAHLAGCAIAMAVTIGVFPGHVPIILTVGTVTTAFTYLAQTLVAGTLEEMDERRRPV